MADDELCFDVVTQIAHGFWLLLAACIISIFVSNLVSNMEQERIRALILSHKRACLQIAWGTLVRLNIKWKRASVDTVSQLLLACR